jgi:hypothetical protein
MILKRNVKPQASIALSGHFRLAHLEVQGRASSILPQLKSFADDIGFCD